MFGRQSGSEEGKKLICSPFSGMPFCYLREGVVISSFSYILIIFIIKMITRVAWKANKVSDGLHLLDLIKNQGQLNCRAVVLCWPVIALETGDDIVGGTTAGIVTQFLPNNVYPLSVDFANFLSKLFYLNRGVLNILLLTVQYRRQRAQITLSPSLPLSAFAAFFKWNSAEILSEPRMFIWNFSASVWDRLHLYDNVNSF